MQLTIACDESVFCNVLNTVISISGVDPYLVLPSQIKANIFQQIQTFQVVNFLVSDTGEGVRNNDNE